MTKSPLRRVWFCEKMRFIICIYSCKVSHIRMCISHKFLVGMLILCYQPRDNTLGANSGAVQIASKSKELGFQTQAPLSTFDVI